MIAAFPDTNFFLHFRALNEIDWCDVLQATAVEIKIIPVVTRELEEQKTLHPSRRIRERAATALKLLHGYLVDGRVRDGVTLQFIISEPTVESARTRGLNLQLGDDRLIGTLLLYRDENPGVPCTLVTSDLPLKVKATHYEIPLTAPSESLRLPSEPDPLEKQNKQLQAELLRYQSREPILDILFANGATYSQFGIARPTVSGSEAEVQIQSMLAAAKEKCPLVEIRPEANAETTTPNNPFAELVESLRVATAGIQSFAREFSEDYNARARKYYGAHEKYLRDSVAFETRETRTIRLDLMVANTGTCPAEDIYVYLHFPDGFEIYDELHPPQRPKEPIAPSKEMNLFANFALAPSFPDIRLPRLRDPSLPRIRKTNSYEVDFEIDKLQHRFNWSVNPFFVTFDSYESAKSFSIGYAVSAGNMLDERVGKLGVIIQKN